MGATNDSSRLYFTGKFEKNSRIKTSRIVLLIWLFAQAVAFGQTNAVPSAPPPSATGNSVLAAYGGSASCRECHEEIYDNWLKSHHARAERPPDPSIDNAAFIPPKSFVHGTQRTSLRATNGQYQVITSGLHGTNEVFPVARVLAENPLRQMLIPLPGGRVQVTEAAWDPRSNDWFNVYGNEDRKPGEWGQWLGRGMNWNSMCAACHNTRVQKNYDAATDTYRTAMVEHGVGCESCHGPLRAHNDWRHAHKDSDLPDPTVKKLTRENYFSVCADCHSRRGELTGDPVPGDDFFDHHQITIVDETDTFYPDGQIRDEDYEVTAFLGSRMHQKGVRCMDCHDVHTMKTKLPGNFLCLSCHGPGATNAPAINPVTHSHHLVFGYNTNGVMTNADLSKYVSATVKETGGECVNCHMPQTPYMVRHWRHDHGFTIPDPLLTKQFNIPNACERCHADKGTDWNLKYVEQWYGTNMDRPYRAHGQTIARARQGDSTMTGPLVKMLVTDEQFYWRAVAANLLQRWCGEPPVTAGLMAALADTNALVRQCAVAALGSLAQGGRPEIIAALRPLLKDPFRNVRIAAAQQFLASLDTNSLAGRDFLRFMACSADQPLGQLQIGMFDYQRGDATNALAHFQTAAKWDPYSPGVCDELATLLSQLGRTDEAVAQLQKAVELSPTNADGHFRLALGLNDTGNSAGALAELEKAVKLDPRHARAAYNLGLARNAAGDSAGALQALDAAAAADPRDAQIPYARATILARLGRMEEARAAAKAALGLNPRFTEASDLLQSLPGESVKP